MKKLIATAILASLPIVSPAASNHSDISWFQRDTHGNLSLNLYFYWSKNCRHCHEAIPYIKRMVRQNPWIKLTMREVSSEQNIQEYIRINDATGGIAAGAVPAFFYCGQAYTGYTSGSTGPWLLSELKACRKNPADFDIHF